MFHSVFFPMSSFLSVFKDIKIYVSLHYSFSSTSNCFCSFSQNYKPDAPNHFLKIIFIASNCFSCSLLTFLPSVLHLLFIVITGRRLLSKSHSIQCHTYLFQYQYLACQYLFSHN